MRKRCAECKRPFVPTRDRMGRPSSRQRFCWAGCQEASEKRRRATRLETERAKYLAKTGAPRRAHMRSQGLTPDAASGSAFFTQAAPPSHSPFAVSSGNPSPNEAAA